MGWRQGTPARVKTQNRLRAQSAMGLPLYSKMTFDSRKGGFYHPTKRRTRGRVRLGVTLTGRQRVQAELDRAQYQLERMAEFKNSDGYKRQQLLNKLTNWQRSQLHQACREARTTIYRVSADIIQQYIDLKHP